MAIWRFSKCRLSRSPYQHAVLLARTKFRWNRTIGWWVMARKAIFKMAAATILNFKNFNFVTWLSSGSISDAMYQVSWKSDDFSLRYDNLTIFQNGGGPPRWILKICSFCHAAFVGMPFCFPHTIFRRNRTIGRWVMAKTAIFKIRSPPSSIPKNFNFWSRGCNRVQYLM